MKKMEISNEEILLLIENEKYEWQGNQNGDDYRKFQARQSEKVAYLLILINRVLLAEKPILSKDQMEHVLNQHIRQLAIFDDHQARTNDVFSFKSIRSEWTDIINLISA